MYKIRLKLSHFRLRFRKKGAAERLLSRLHGFLTDQAGDLPQILLRDIIPLKQRVEQTDDLRLVAVREDGGGEILFTGHGRAEDSAVGFAALDETGFPDRALLKQTIQQDMHRTVFPGFFLGALQKIGTGQGLAAFPKNIHNFHFTFCEFHPHTSSPELPVIIAAQERFVNPESEKNRIF